MNLRNVLSVFLLCTFSAGCGGVKYGEVSGKVTFRDSVLPAGTVTFWTKGVGAPATALIEDDGTYTASVPVGEVTVTVETESVLGSLPSPVPMMNRTDKAGKPIPVPGGPPPEVMEKIRADLNAKMKAAEGQRGTYVKINPRYSRPDQSDLKTTVQSGHQEFNIDMK